MPITSNEGLYQITMLPKSAWRYSDVLKNKAIKEHVFQITSINNPQTFRFPSNYNRTCEYLTNKMSTHLATSAAI